jgi:CheY-like chemotaxis protein
MGQLKHILVVDDNGDVRDVIVDTLQERNRPVSAALREGSRWAGKHWCK